MPYRPIFQRLITPIIDHEGLRTLLKSKKKNGLTMYFKLLKFSEMRHIETAHETHLNIFSRFGGGGAYF